MRQLSELAFLLLVIAAAARVSAQSGTQKPPRVYVDAGACPFECCAYRQWTVSSDVPLVDAPKSKRVIENLRKGDIVTGLTGEVISEPIPVKADRDVPDTPIKRGDTFYVLRYEGEGYWKAWFEGKTTLVDQGVMNILHPESEWWVKIKDARGTVGWALSRDNFAHQDACE